MGLNFGSSAPNPSCSMTYSFIFAMLLSDEMLWRAEFIFQLQFPSTVSWESEEISGENDLTCSCSYSGVVTASWWQFKGEKKKRKSLSAVLLLLSWLEEKEVTTGNRLRVVRWPRGDTQQHQNQDAEKDIQLERVSINKKNSFISIFSCVCHMSIIISCSCVWSSQLLRQTSDCSCWHVKNYNSYSSEYRDHVY